MKRLNDIKGLRRPRECLSLSRLLNLHEMLTTGTGQSGANEVLSRGLDWSVTPFSVEQRYCLPQTDIVSEKFLQTPGHCVMAETLQGAAIADL